MLTAQTAEMYAVADPDYYEPLDRLPDASSRFDLDAAELPPGWTRRWSGLWTALHAPAPALPAQGWKIHISATEGEAAGTLRRVAELCLARPVTFKFLRSARALRYAGAKYASRGGSGKFITVYPVSEEDFAALVTELAAALDGRSGPTILSDLRIGAGPVHVRYGAFQEMWCTADDGRQVRAVRDPAGRLVPDERAPSFRLPGWVTPPEVLRPHLDLRAAIGALDLPYRVIRPLHFTNAGGTYLAEHRVTGQKVVLREARPHSGLDGAGLDAVTRLRHEHQILTELAGLDCVPEVYGLRRAWEHEFLIEEYVEGQNLLDAFVARNPIGYREPSAATLADYAAWVDRIVARVGQALDALHARGISFGDLHPGNVVVRPDESVMLIDFEYAGREGHPRAGSPGLVAPREADRVTADRFALRRLWLMLLLPLIELVEMDRGKEARFEAVARDLFGPGPGPERPALPAALFPPSGEDVVERLLGSGPLDWPAIRDALAAGILGAATPDRTDRLFPASPQTFDNQGFALAYGAAGVLLALHRAGVAVPAEQVDWLVTAARRAHAAGRARPGLLDGLAGAAVALHELGREAEAQELIGHLTEAAPPRSADVMSGRAGIALALLNFVSHTSAAALVERATATAWEITETEAKAAPEKAGLLYGSTGAALLHLRLFRITGDDAHLRAGRRALARDLEQCVRMPDGTVQVRAGRRHLVYLEGGSGGIALVAREYLAHRPDAELAAFVRAVSWGCQPYFVREPGLLHGRAGVSAMLARLGGDEAAVRDQVRRLSWYAVGRDQALLIPGARLRRFTADLATGSAGVLAAVQASLTGGPFPLPALFES
jgi:hypothetical protein